MDTLSFLAAFSLSKWLRKLLGGNRCRRLRPARKFCRLTPELLEDRLAPAVLSESGSILTITLNNANETLSLFASGGTQIRLLSTNPVVSGLSGGSAYVANSANDGVLTPAPGRTEIDIVDSADNTSVRFLNSNANVYSKAFVVNLDSATSGSITFLGASSHFSSGLLATTVNGSITSVSSSLLDVTGALTLSVGATGGDLGLAGQVLVSGAASLSNSGSGDISAVNPTNDFNNTVALSSTSASAAVVLEEADTLALAAVNVAGDLSVTALAGSIIQTVGLSVGGTSSFNATGGAITINDPTNALTGAVALTTNLNNNIALFNSMNTQLGDVVLDTGALTITARGNITQPFNLGSIKTHGNATFRVDTVTGDLLLGVNGRRNDIGGSVTFDKVNGGVVHDIALANFNASAQFPILTGLSPHNLTLVYPNNAIVLPALTLTGDLSVTAGGPITQTGAITAVKGTFDVIGNHGITLTNTSNVFSGAVSLNNLDADNTPLSAVAFTNNNAGGTTLANCNLGLSTFSVTARQGNISQPLDTIIQQARGAGTATFTATAGSSVFLGRDSNRFEGGVTIVGPSVTSVSLTNSSTLARLPMFPASVTSLALSFTSAPIVLPSLTLTTLNVIAPGIRQQAGSVLTIGSFASFQTSTNRSQPNGGEIALTGANDFTTISVISSGPNDVTINDVNGLDFGSSSLGTGAFQVTAGGPITEETGNVISQAAGAVSASFTTGAAAITLDSTNEFTGPLSLVNQGNNDVTIGHRVDLVLGTSVIGGNLTTTGSGNVTLTQAPGSTLTVGGKTVCKAGSITLDNLNNAFTGDLGLTTTLSDATVRDSGAVNLRTCSVAGKLTVLAGGDITQTDPATKVSAVNALFDAGTNSVLLDNPGNDFAGAVSLTSTGPNPVLLTDATDLQLGSVRLGSGNLTLALGGNLSQAAGGALTQTGAGSITITNALGKNVVLNQAANDIRGTIALGLSAKARNVTVITRGDITFTAASDMQGDVNLLGGGIVTLPSHSLALNFFTSNARQTTVSAGITAQSIQFTGATLFTTALTLDVSAGSTQPTVFNDDVTAMGALTLNLRDSGRASFSSGVWKQGSNDLTITGNSVEFDIQGTFIMTGGTLRLPGTDANLTIQGGTFQVGELAGTAETVKLDVSGDITFSSFALLVVGLGITNDKLDSVNTGNVIIDASDRLVGTGLADTAASNVLQAAGAIVGRFSQTVDADDNLHDFLMGIDIVTPSYSTNALSIKQGGTESANGTVTGFQSDSDRYTVTASTGAAAKLVAIQNTDGQLDVVVRNAATAVTLTITTTKNVGDGFTEVGGIAINGPAAATIVAGSANIKGDSTVEGQLAALTVRDMSSDRLTAGGTSTQTTTIIGRNFVNVRINLGTVLSALTVKQLRSTSIATTPGVTSSSITAERFGTITTTSNKALGINGDFQADLVKRGVGMPAVSTVTVAGTLGGFWDLSGSVGTITSHGANKWALGSAAGAKTHNGNLLTNVTSLNLGSAVATFINAVGNVGTVTAINWFGGALAANTFGTIKTTGAATPLNPGDIEGVTIEAKGNLGGKALTAIGTLSVAGGFLSSTLRIDNGNVTTLTVGRSLDTVNIIATATPTTGAISTLKTGRIANLSLEARSVGTLSAMGNTTALILGTVDSSTVLLHGTPNVNAVTLGTFSASGDVTDSFFRIENGRISSFTAARLLQDTPITVRAALGGSVGTIKAGEWKDSPLTALAIGTMSVTGAPAGPAGPALIGDMSGSGVTTFRAPGTTPSIAAFSVAGNLSTSSINAANGITAFTVKRAVFGGSGNLINAGRVGTLTAGSWDTLDLRASFLGSVNITGYSIPEGDSPLTMPGDFTNSNVRVTGSGQLTSTSPVVGIDTFTIAGELGGGASFNSFTVAAPSGIRALTVKGVADGLTISTDNPAASSSGRLGNLTMGSASSLNVRANSAGTLTTTGVNLSSGGMESSDITITGFTGPVTSPVAVSTISIAGDVFLSSLNVPDGITTLTVAGLVDNSELAAAFGPNARLTTLSAAEWVDCNLTSQSVGTWSVPGSNTFGLASFFSESTITITGNTAGVALASFTAAGTVLNSVFNITGGNVTAFTAGRFLGSDLMVGFQMPKTADLTVTPAGSNWLGNFLLDSFKTTALFSSADVANTASFRDSNVVAAKLGTVALTSVDTAVPEDSFTVTFGVAFRQTTGVHGTVKVGNLNGGIALTDPFQSDDFRYVGLVN